MSNIVRKEKKSKIDKQKVLPFLVFSLLGNCLQDGLHCESWFKSPLKKEGFFWGKDLPKPPEKDKNKEKDPVKEKALPETNKGPEEILEDMRKEESKKHAKFLLEGTEDSAKEYLRIRNKLIFLAMRGEEILTKLQKIDPEFNARNITQMPSGAYGQKLFEDRQKRESEEKLSLFAKDHSMILFFSEKCDESIRQAVTVYSVSRELRMPVIAYSPEGKPLKEILVKKIDYEFAKSLGVKKLPTVVFLKNNGKGKTPTVSFLLQGYKVVDEVAGAICAYMDLEKMRKNKETKQ